MATLSVTANEARDRLPELLARAAAGDRVVITDGDRPPAELTRRNVFPPPPKTEAEVRARQIDFFRMVIENHARDGHPLPADHDLCKVVAEWDGANS